MKQNIKKFITIVSAIAFAWQQSPGKSWADRHPFCFLRPLAAIEKENAATGGSKQILSEGEIINLIKKYHLEVYRRIRRRYGDELWDRNKGIYTYTMTDPIHAVEFVKLLRHRGYLKPGTRFADLGCANGFVVHLVNALAEGVDVTGVDMDFRLLGEAKAATSKLSDPKFTDTMAPVIDKKRVHWENEDYMNDDFNLSRFDVIYIYPPMKRSKGSRPHPDMGPSEDEVVMGLDVSVDLLHIVNRMRRGSAIALHMGGRVKKFDKSPLLEYVPEIDAYRRIEDRRLRIKLKQKIKGLLEVLFGPGKNAAIETQI
jgi:hypothetical protein